MPDLQDTDLGQRIVVVDDPLADAAGAAPYVGRHREPDPDDPTTPVPSILGIAWPSSTTERRRHAADRLAGDPAAVPCSHLAGPQRPARPRRRTRIGAVAAWLTRPVQL